MMKELLNYQRAKEQLMKILGIVCSPRLHGNTEILMQEALKSAEEEGAEVELFKLSGKTIYPCDGCDSCVKSGKCRINDDMEPLYQKMAEADGIIFGTPVYFWSVCAQAKIIIDRTYAFRRQRSLRNKVGAVLVATTRAGGTSAFTVFNNFFNLQRMIRAGGAIAFGKDRGDVRKDERGMAEAKGVGRVVLRFIKRLSESTPDAELEKPMMMPPRKMFT